MEMAAASSVNVVAVLGAALSAFVLGGIWYSAVFAKAWQVETGLSDERLASGNPALIYGGSFLACAVAAFVLSLVIGPGAGAAAGAGAGAAVGFAWVGASFGVNDLFERRSLKLWAINAGYHALLYTGMGTILGLWG